MRDKIPCSYHYTEFYSNQAGTWAVLHADRGMGMNILAGGSGVARIHK
jgi:hypothetical protein